ncbi:TlpA family protein disulfide reductase [Mucilaginibacter sp. UYCu711]|uniref:TlpA family protein disulfide reductase n=1 Tax=Mucilaginibacter sp. UYCu711 TaxID=3156339 RepID=UPI003D1D6AB2
MKKIIFALLILAAPAITRAQAPDPDLLVKVGDQAPAFDFYIAKGQKTSLDKYKGRIVMINFFATWCGPCRLELPRVQAEIWNKYKDNPKFALFILGRDEDWDVVLPFKDKFKYTLPILPDKGKKVYSLYAKQMIPRNFILDENGKVIYQSMGYSAEEFEKLLALLADRLK